MILMKMVVPMKLIVMTAMFVMTPMMVIMMTKIMMMDPPLPGQTDEVLGQRGLPRCNPCNLLNPANG